MRIGRHAASNHTTRNGRPRRLEQDVRFLFALVFKTAASLPHPQPLRPRPTPRPPPGKPGAPPFSQLSSEVTAAPGLPGASDSLTSRGKPWFTSPFFRKEAVAPKKSLPWEPQRRSWASVSFLGKKSDMVWRWDMDPYGSDPNRGGVLSPVVRAPEGVPQTARIQMDLPPYARSLLRLSPSRPANLAQGLA